MPLYEYLCRDCERQSELLVSSDGTVDGGQQPACPECGGQKLMKLLSVPAAPAASGAEGGPGPQSGGGHGCGSGCGCFPGS
ncbi:Zinc ribbon domain protein [Pseudobythopirellula maris]|uniref:Zinc ribbon domain protein n=1 Tax=Pseudobythopirellula maris TaxID=2527991 RepID=A0A5C5ZNX0_9BACT|nr:zinc ribbon domain-containing protein [Pseudobythopirellula maris]TWT88878.1 Zinc ribbon domain protein [Pseudobythopirellula maris]